MRIIAFIVIILACQVPPIRYFSDELLLPKWYCCAIVLVVYFLTGIITSKRRCIQHREVWYDIFLAASVAITLQCCYAIINSTTCPNDGIWLQGTFDNPAALAFHLCLLIPLVCIGEIALSWLCVFRMATIALAVTTIILTESRTGVITLVLMGCIYFLSKCKWRKLMKCSIILCVIAGLSVFCLTRKSDSTQGRKFILQTTWSLICERPLAGHGSDGFHREYMRRQGEYFSLHPDSEFAMLADEIRHPLNDYLYVWTDYGIVGVVVLIGLMILPICRKLYPVIPIVVFSVFSYPLCYPMTWLALLGMNGYAIYLMIKKCKHGRYNLIRIGSFMQSYVGKGIVIVLATFCLASIVHESSFEYHWSRIAHRAERGHSKAVISEFDGLYNHYIHNPYFLYNYMSVQYHAGEFSKALHTYNKLRCYWSGYNIELLAGDTYRQLNRYAEAIYHYQNALNMCPNRFAPLEGMYLSFDNLGDGERCDSVANIIEAKQVKVYSYDVERIKSLIKR